MLPRPVLVLGVVVLVELVLFTSSTWQRWRKALAPLGRPEVHAGEGLTIRSDGLGYYAWLRSLLIDGDWSFDNEFNDHNPLGDYVPPPSRRTSIGRRANPWSVGPACAWAVLLIPVHLCVKALPGLPWPADGYTLPYQLGVGCTTLLASFLAFGFLYGICRRAARPDRAALAAAFLLLGSTAVYYGAVEVGMAHGLATAAVAGLVWYWQRTYGSESPGRWLLLGVLVGLTALMRWQLVTFAVLPVGEALLRGGERRWLGVTLAAVAAVVAFVPQMIAWRQVYGAWLVTPYPVAHNWLAPSWWQVLGAHDRGLFYWTPIALIGAIGCVAACRTGRAGRVNALHRVFTAPARPVMNRLLLVALVLQVYAVASVWGAEAYLGASYGFRPLTESVAVLAPGLAYLLDRASPRGYLILCATACLLVLWNLVLIAQYRYGWVPAAGGAGPDVLVANAVRLFQRKHVLELAQIVTGPLLLGVLAYRSYRFPGPDALG